MHVIAIKPVFASLRGLCERGDVVPPGNPPATILSGSEVTMSPGCQWRSSRHTHGTPSSTYLHAVLCLLLRFPAPLVAGTLASQDVDCGD